MGKLSIRRIVCGLYEANCFAITTNGRKDAVIIDPGDGYAQINAQINRDGLSVTDIVLTHGHFDHILSASRIARDSGARVLIHIGDAHMLCDAGAALYTAALTTDAFMAMPHGEAISFADGDLLDLCGVPFTALHTPGHTPGSACLYSPEEGVMFTGDTLFSDGYGKTTFPGGDGTQMRASLRRLAQLPPETVIYPGHYDGTALGASPVKVWR